MAVNQAGGAYQTPGQVRKAFVIRIVSIITGVGLVLPIVVCLGIYASPSKSDKIEDFYQLLSVLSLWFLASSLIGVLAVWVYLFEWGGLPRYQERLAQAYADEAGIAAKTAIPIQLTKVDTFWAALKRFFLFFVPTLAFVAAAAVAANEWFGGEQLHRGQFVLNGAGFWVAAGGFLAAVATYVSRERTLGRYATTKLSIEPKTENGLVELSWRKQGHPDVWVRAWKYQREVPHGIEDEAHVGNPRERIVNTTQGEGVFRDHKVSVRETGLYGFVLQAEGPAFYPVEKVINLQFETVSVYLPPVVIKPVEKEPEKPIGERVREETDTFVERILAEATSEIDAYDKLVAERDKRNKRIRESGKSAAEIKDDVDFNESKFRDVINKLKNRSTYRR